jgi:putative transposase
MRGHCAHSRFVWNMAVEQSRHWTPGRAAVPSFIAQCRQLTEARTEFAWLAAGSQTVQQQALRDFAQAMSNFFKGTHGRPTWHKAGRKEGFRIVGPQAQRVRRLSRHVGQVWVPKAGWVRFRWSRLIPADAKSYRVTLDRAGRWHIAFATIPAPIPGPGDGSIVGIDRGIAVSAALSTGELLTAPRLSAHRQQRLGRLQRRLARSKRGSNRRARVKSSIARMHALQSDSRKDWCEQTSTAVARRFDVIRLEDLRISDMVRSSRGTVGEPGHSVSAKSGPNRGILASGGGVFGGRLADKAPRRVERVNPAFTSQRCSACGYVSAENRKSQASFACIACKFACNADVNAARNIAAGHAVTARGGFRVAGPMNREPQPALLS